MPRYRRGSGSVYRRGKHLWLSYYRDGRRIRDGSNQGSSRGSPPAQSEARQNRGRHIQRTRGRPRHLRTACAGKRAHLITTSDIRAFVTRRQKQGASNAEINREIAALKRAFNLGLQGGTISRKPQFIRLSENNVRRGFFERREFAGEGSSSVGSSRRYWRTYQIIFVHQLPSHISPDGAFRAKSLP